ncbi:MAG: metal-dependent hydrolase [Bacteroidetes bacterium]|nr:metal-dependent hydrolase [Bacteroidota bacterium]
MASAFSHAIASLAVGRITPVVRDWRFWLIGAIGAAIPDLDALGYWAGVPYDSMWGHRGITHSFFFAALYSLAALLLFYRSDKYDLKIKIILFLSFFVSVSSHALLDACTTGGLGVDLFAPFHDERYFLPWRVIRVSPISISRFFTYRGLEVLASEFVWIWIPTIIVFVLSAIWNKVRKDSSASS